MGNKRSSIHILLLSFLFMLLGTLLFIHYEQRVIIEEYQDVITKQDSMIRDMSFSRELVKEYFDIKEDTLTHQKSYVLKSDKSKKEREYVEVEPTFLYDGEEISADELVKQVNTNESQKVEVINDLVNKCNDQINEKKNLKDTLQMHKMALGLIKKNYGIDFTGNIKDSKISIHLICDQADSAFILLNLYRDRMIYDSGKKAWIISH